MLPVEQPFKTYTGLDGKPLDNGYVWFGQPNQNPQAAPVTVFWDAAGTIPATQPLRTVNGYIYRGGTPANVFFDGAYSELVWDSKKRQVFYARTSEEFGIASTVTNFINSIIASTGASVVGFMQAGVGAIVQTVLDALRERVTARQFGAKFDNVTDDGPAFNRAILKLSLDGGGTLRAGRGTCKAVTSILLASNVKLDLSGCTINGNGSNTLIKSGAVLNGVLTDITPEYGTQGQGAGTNLVLNAQVVGGRLANAACGIRGHRFNYGTIIEKVVFDATLTNSWITSHSWGLKVHQNLVYSPAIMKDFVDWTEISGNSFEGPSYAYGTAALTFATGGYGGSYSALVRSNGFHHWANGVVFACEATNTVIECNHFEDTKYHVSGGTQLVKKARIRNNWMKANLAPSGSGVIPIAFQSIWDSELGPNEYSTDGASAFDAYVAIPGSNCFGNHIALPYSPPSTLDMSMYQVGDANEIAVRGGSNDESVVQPAIEVVSGSGNYTVEKYKSRYHAVANTIPYCTVAYNAGTITIDTWIVSDAFGTRQLVACNFSINGANAYQVSGFIAGLVFTPAANVQFFGTASPLTITPSNNGGILRITITGASAVGNITGWVKEL